MPFQPGNKLTKLRKHNRGGRPDRKSIEKQKTAAEIVRKILEGNAEAIGKHYTKRALGKNGDRVLCHAIDKILPDEQMELTRPLIVNFLRFGSDPSGSPSTPIVVKSHIPAPAKELPAPIVVESNKAQKVRPAEWLKSGNGNRDQESSQGAAPPAIRFHDFSNPEKRRK